MTDFDGVTEEQLADPLYRLGVRTGTSIYTIQGKDAKGDSAGPIPFRPTPEQQEVISCIFLKGWEFLVIPKARQLGMSTVICLCILDCMLFASGIQASIVDKTADDAEIKLRDKIKYAYDALPSAFTQGYQVLKSNESLFSIKRRGAKQDDACSVSASLSARGGTNHILLISEWGTIQNQSSGRSRSVEILTGALPTAKHPGCITIIETTWKGGRAGELWPIVAEAMKTRNTSPAEWHAKTKHMLFFGWQTNPANRVAGNPQSITKDTHVYCDKMERLVGRLDNQQRLWWQDQKKEYGIFMSRENPTTEDECFDSPHEGMVFCPIGLKYQENTAIGLETKWRKVDISLHGEDDEYAHWAPSPNPDKAVYWMLEPPPQVRGVESGFRQNQWTTNTQGETESYIITADFCGRRQVAGASGERDTNAYGVWKAARLDLRTGIMRPPQLVCCCLMDDRSDTTVTIMRIKAMYRLYGNCTVVPEVNNKDDIAERLIGAGVTNVWKQSIASDGAPAGEGKTEDVYGWHTNEGSKKRMMDALQEAIREQSIIVGLGFIVHQLTVFILDAKGKLRASDGEHDDFVIMCALAVLLMGAATPYKPPDMQAAAAAGDRVGYLLEHDGRD